MPTERPPFFIHVHVPKTGGTSFTRVLARNFGDAYDPFEGRWIHHVPRLTRHQIRSYLTEHPGVRATSSHAFSVDLPYGMPGRQVVGIAWVRDPVATFFSLYFHLRRFQHRDDVHNRLLLPDYVAHHEALCAKAGRPHAGQWQHLTLGLGSPQVLGQFRRLVDAQQFFLLPTRDMAGGLALLQRRFPAHFVDITVERANVSPRDQEVTPALRARVEALLNPYDHHLLALAEHCLAAGSPPP